MNDQPDRDEDAFATRARERFEESVSRIDGATQSKLTQARHRALAELAAPRPVLLRWAPAAGVTAAAVVAVVMWSGGPGVVDIGAPDTAGDMEILLTEDSLEMLEDLEFYSWIDFDEEQSPEPENHVG